MEIVVGVSPLYEKDLAAVTVHASFYEGIIGCLPLFESLSVGTPCLFAHGPHTTELLADEPGFAPYAFDPYDVEGLIALVRHTIARREEVTRDQQRLYERLSRRTWSDVADGYVAAALSGQTAKAA